jgi:TorA maturation chaperone TorD
LQGRWRAGITLRIRTKANVPASKARRAGSVQEAGRIGPVVGLGGVASPEDWARAEHYRLLGRLLAAPPDAEMLALCAGLEGGDTAIGEALRALAREAAATTPEAVRDEHFALFIGIGRGELLPYASYYLTGFLNERPLAKLRVDMARLGIEREANVKEPEDHIAALCEMMAGLITGEFAYPLDLAGQRAFFDAHLAAWGPRFFADLEAAAAARLYRPVGALGREFLEIEVAAFAMAP